MRPAVIVDPAVAWGRPAIRGIHTEAIACLYWAENGDEETVMADYGLTRHELATALWHEGTHGLARRRYPGWKVWADDVAYPRLAGWRLLDVDTLPLPPGKDEEPAPAA